MNWMVRLYESYDPIIHLCEQEGFEKPWPLSHMVKNTHIEIALDMQSNFIKNQTKVLDAFDSPTLIPVTESSAGRTGRVIAPHPVCEELGYCASDLPNTNSEKNKKYIEQIKDWFEEDPDNQKLHVIYEYLKKVTLWSDLKNTFDFPLKVKKSDGTNQSIKTEKVFIRWRVLKPGDVNTGTWEDDDFIKSWVKYDNKYHSDKGFCYILGNQQRTIGNHPRFLRRPGDGAKLISSNDSSGYTFLGRFTDKTGKQAATISFDVTQKAHNALRWLISRQGSKIGATKDDPGSVVVAWAVSGKEIPQPLEETYGLLEFDFEEKAEKQEEVSLDHTVNLGQSFSLSLQKYMRGYRAKLDESDNIIIMGLDSATPGRMAVTYYQEFFPKQYIDQISAWHIDFAWFQRFSKDKHTIWSISAPSVRSIWETVYGGTVSDSLKKNIVERILPCIIEGRSFPRDLLNLAIHKVSNRSAYKKDEQWLWEKNLGTTCALYRGFSKRHSKKEYKMALDLENNSRDYLYGRLLAIAERIEEVALHVSGEERSTTAARLMQRFADRPFSTWRNIELALQPYIQRLKNNRAGFLHNIQFMLDEVMSCFDGEDFNSDKSLSGEFLLAFHSQRLAFRNSKTTDEQSESNN